MSDPPILDPLPLQDLLEIGAPPALIQELIGLFQEDVPARLVLLKTALAAADAEQAAAEAHQLKGALGNLGLVHFADLAARIETHAWQGRLEEVSPLAEALPAAYEAALQALKVAFPAA